ncbi:BTB/POZ domain-containing protein [Dorcoceras hygrometricum]|uniref:BTB/POZ domain-containing protein n=1 Tax=Dorcoceras hygrometricum TaxID=472368 RepID=A0A2Z7D296_9LAMI|nr:BTB/POZ domain-containing protein [Dorcoceras hygrometricum]
MLRALREKKADPEGASRSLGKGKRKITEEGGEKPKKRHHEKKTRESDRDKVSGETTKETPSSGGQNPEQQTNETSYEYLDASNISFVAKPSGSVSLDFTRRLISDQDYDLVNSVPDLAALEAASLHFMQFYINLIFPFIGSDVRPNHHGFDGCLAQFRESGYTEEEHPAPFLDVERALASMSDDEDAEEDGSGRKKTPPA